ncbi:MAG TPA: TetR/AcrR family transcriptional regulator [bacterium]|nr:TetR/AcrR family transcriptional regulator [bacterium]
MTETALKKSRSAKTDSSTGISSAQARRDRTRRRILDSAKKIISRKGYEAASVSDIVKNIDMSQGIFYYHFKDKKAVLVELLNEFFSAARQMASTWAETTDTGADTAEQFYRSVAALLGDNRELAMIIRRENFNSDPEIRKMIQDFYGFLYSRTEMALELGMSLGSVRKLDPAIAAVASIGMLKEVVFAMLDRRGPIDIDRVMKEVTSIQNYGIRPADNLPDSNK